MLRVPQHDRKNIIEINTHPFVLSVVEGLREEFFNRLSKPELRNDWNVWNI
jgi:hypothetical protein